MGCLVCLTVKVKSAQNCRALIKPKSVIYNLLWNKSCRLINNDAAPGIFKLERDVKKVT